MKTEIKEILQLIGDCCYYGKISEDKCKKYCNYITNLQEELKSANESITWWTNRFKAVEEENKRLHTRIKTIKRRRKAQTAKMRKYREEITNKQNSIVDYKSRNEKAIEYLHHFDSNEICENITGIAKISLNILEGEDKDE